MADFTLGTLVSPASEWESEQAFAEEQERQLKSVRRLMGESEGYFLRDAVPAVRDCAKRGQLLAIKKMHADDDSIEGMVGYTQPLIQGISPKSGLPIMRRVTMLRLLIVRDSEYRPQLALRLCLEAQLRAAVRSMYDDEDLPHATGAFGVIMRSNGPALGWAQKLGPRARIVLPTSPIVRRDPTLLLVRDMAEDIRISVQSEQPYCFVVANRRTLLEAAVLHQAGRLPILPGSGGLNVYYDSADDFQDKVDALADNISWGNPVAWRRMGLEGSPRATVWGPPPAAQMRLGDDRPRREAT
jgi:hypothetical protein